MTDRSELSLRFGDVRIPATFHGTARLLDPAEPLPPPAPPGYDDLPGQFHAKLDITFDLLVGLGYGPVDPSHPAYPRYLAASAASEPAPAPPGLAGGIDRHPPDAIVFPFQTTTEITAAMALEHGLVAPGRAGSGRGRDAAPPQPVWRGLAPPLDQPKAGSGGAPPPPIGDFDAFLDFLGHPERAGTDGAAGASPFTASGWTVGSDHASGTAPAAAMEDARQGGSRARSDHGPGLPVPIVPPSLPLDAGADSKGGRTREDPGAVEAPRDKLGPRQPAPGPRPAEGSGARSVPLAPACGPRGAGRFDTDRLAGVDLNALGLGEALRTRSASPGAPFVRAPVPGPGPEAAEDDVPVLAGATPSFGTGRRSLDVVMTPGAAVPPAIRAAVGGAGGSQAGWGAATSAGPSGADADGDVPDLLRAEWEAAAPPIGSTSLAPGWPPSLTCVPPAPLTTSDAGLVFIEKEEELPGVSNTLHHPSAASGVTLGPGYDMKKKSAEEIVAKLKELGIAEDVAKKISGAAHLPRKKIRKFIKDNKSLIDLSSAQQARLLALTIGPYQDKVRRDIKVPLKPYEFDALVSFLYNPGRGWPHVRKAINKGDYQAAAVAMKKQVKSGRKVLQDLVGRRQREADLLLNGNYGTKK